MAVYQITRIQHRRGTSGELPDALADGEIGMTSDTAEVFFGAPNHPSVAGRKSYPYQNIKILTEHDVQYGINGDVYYHGPLVGASVPSSYQFASVIPLFARGTRDFAVYDFSVSGNNGSIKAMGQLSVAVHPDANQSSVDVSIKARFGGDFPLQFRLTNLDDEGQDTGTTWLAFNNNVGTELILGLSGREWSNPTV